MKGMAATALASLAGLVACLVVYLYYPLPTSSFDWQDPHAWLPVLLLTVGLICFILLLISGLVTILNWASDRPSESGHHR